MKQPAGRPKSVNRERIARELTRPRVRCGRAERFGSGMFDFRGTRSRATQPQRSERVEKLHRRRLGNYSLAAQPGETRGGMGTMKLAR